MVAFIDGRKPTADEIVRAREEFGDYIKIVIDIKTKKYTIGGRLHADGEKILLNHGSLQKNLWGGGYDLLTNEIDANALINTRPENQIQEILDPKIRERFLHLAAIYLKPL